MAYQSKYSGKQIEDKLDQMQKITVGDGLTLENGVLKCSFTPTRYYTGSTAPASGVGNDGDLYLIVE